MSLKSLSPSILVGLFIISCNSSTFIEVSKDSSLSLQDVSIVDYDFTTAISNGSERVFFEFVTNRELESSTVVIFRDQAGNIIARSEVGTEVNQVPDVESLTDSPSFVYSISLGEIRSVSLVQSVVIGSP